MWVLTRTVMAWLLLLAIPAQGFAVALMVFCGPGDHSSFAKVANLQPRTDHATAGAHLKHGHSHASLQKEQPSGDVSINVSHADHAAARAVGEPETQKIATSNGGGHGSGKCSACACACACASYCNGAAMVSEFPHFSVQPPTSQPNTKPVFGVMGYIPSELERPPRVPLA